MLKANVIVYERAILGIGYHDYETHCLEVKAWDIPEVAIKIIDETDAPCVDFILCEGNVRSESVCVPFSIFNDPIGKWDLKRRMLAYEWFKKIPLSTKSALFEAWYILKFLCQELSDKEARALGRELAGLGSDLTDNSLESFRLRILSILKMPSTPKKIRGSLWKNYSNQLKKTNHTLKEINDPKNGVGESTLICELAILEKEATEKSIFFGTSPVIYLA